MARKRTRRQGDKETRGSSSHHSLFPPLFTQLHNSPAPIRLVVFLLALLLLWLPIAAPIYWLVDDQNLVDILTIPLLYGEFVFLLLLWGKYVHLQSKLLRHYGLETTRRNGKELLIGIGTGITAILSLFLVEGWLGWLIWQHPNIFLPRLILEGLVVALGYGLAEELLFRGWLLDELQRDYLPHVAVWINALAFALLHFIKPLPEIIRTMPQFAGLVLLGLALVWAKQASAGGASLTHSGRLGLPIGLHAGLVWGNYIINVGQLVQYSGQVPSWITGIDKNPLAGMMGMFFLGGIVLCMRRAAKGKSFTGSPRI